MIVAVTGLQREARIAAGPHVRAISCGGQPDILREKLDATLDDRVRGIVSFGICAGLSPGLHPGSCIIASEVIADGVRIPTDGRWSAQLRRQLPEAFAGAIASTAVMLRTAGEKSALFARTGALAADMESHVAAEIARQKQLPFVCLRAVADTASSDLPHAALTAVRANGTVDLAAVFASLVKRPGQIGALVRVARETRAAFASLFRCRDVLGASLAGPDFSEPALDVI